MKKNKKFNPETLGLSENEFNSICNLWYGRISDLSAQDWKEKLIADLHLIVDEEGFGSELQIDKPALLNKISTCSDIDLVQLIIELDKLWNTKDLVYTTSQRVSPNQLFEEF